MSLEIVYKIRRKSDGLFSTGGSRPDFTKKGKVWRSQGDLNRHFGLLLQYKDLDYKWCGINLYKDCEVVILETREAKVSDALEWANKVDESKQNRETEYQRVQARIKEQRRRTEYEKLKKEFENG